MFRSALLVLASLSLVATGHSQDPPERPAKRLAGTLILTAKLDCHGVKVVQATRKPDLEYRAPKTIAQASFRWTMRDRAGAVLATGGFTPAPLDLDPAHEGRPPKIERGRMVATSTHVNVKVPAHPDFAELTFERIDGARRVPFGTARPTAIPTR